MPKRKLDPAKFHNHGRVHKKGVRTSPIPNNTGAVSAGKVVRLYVADRHAVPEIEALGLPRSGDFRVPCVFECDGIEARPADEAMYVGRRKDCTIFHCSNCRRAGLYGPPRRCV